MGTSIRSVFFIILLLLSLLLPSLSIAGVMELSATYSTRESNIDDNNYTKNVSYTGSFAWYFLEMSAIELSYTKGYAKQSLKGASDTFATVYYADFVMLGADLIVTLAKKSSLFQPFIRGGMAKLEKELYSEDPQTGQRDPYGEKIDEVVPSYGVGIKLNFTQGFAIRTSYDRWRSGSNNDKDIWDEAIKAGFSWYF